MFRYRHISKCSFAKCISLKKGLILMPKLNLVRYGMAMMFMENALGLNLYLHGR